MSLINEALKKAQRERSEDSAPAGPAAGARVTKRGKPHSANTLVLLGSGAIVLVVLSVFLTVYLVNRPSASARVAVAAPPSTAKTAPAAPVDSATPPIVAPQILGSTPPPAAAPAITSPAALEPSPATTTKPVVAPTTTPPPRSISPESSPSPAPASTTPAVAAPVANTPAPAVATNPTPAPSSSPAAAAPTLPAAGATPAATSPSTLAPDAPDERVAAFVEAVRVTGIRSSGAESRVLMNERVYRVNDVVERTMNIRLIKAAADSLTFSDPRGVTYVKRF